MVSIECSPLGGGSPSSAMNYVKKIMILVSLNLTVGCSFHSTQWEGVKKLLAERASDAVPESKAYWWDMEHEGELHRLFPVAWEDRIVLTDGSRWMIVLHNSSILMVRDLLESTDFDQETVGQAEMEGNVRAITPSRERLNR